MSCSVVLVEDHALVRRGIRTMLNGESWLEVVGEAADGREALKKVRKLQPEIVLMDVGMTGLCGQEATRRIKQEHSDVRVVGVSIYADRDVVMRMFRAGADAYVPKKSAYSELLDALRAVKEGESYISPTVAGPVLKYRRQGGKARRPADELTAREREVLQLVAEGNTSKEIAKILNVSAKTVDNHRQNMMSKLDLHTVSELTKYAIRKGLTTL